MQVQNEIKYNLTLDDIEKAIKNYVNDAIEFELDKGLTKIEFIYKDINTDDDDRGPYRPIMRLQSATVKPAFLE